MYSKNQMHGKSFENRIKSSNLDRFSHSAADRKRSPDELFDIGAEDDIQRGIPSSIKTTGSSIVGLSSAIRFWESMEYEHRMIIGSYEQKGNVKHFDKIYEFFITPLHRKDFFGRLTIDEIKYLHAGIQVEKFPIGEHFSARQWVKDEIAKLSDKRGYISLNPKIDSKSQRRLQCSISFRNLIKSTESMGGEYYVHSESFGNLPLPTEIISGGRLFRNKR